MRKTLIMLFVVVFTLAFSACGDGGKKSEAKGPDKNATLTFMDAAPNVSLDPYDTTNDSSFSQAVLYAIYDRLVGFDEEGEIVPQLATKWKTSDDLKSITMTLRKDVKFQDGTAFNAEAVKTNLENAKSHGSDTGATVKSAAKSIKDVVVDSPTEVTINLDNPDGGYIYNLGTQLGMMLSPKSLDGSTGVDLEPVGAGPYKVDSFKPTDTTELSRYDGYWDGPKDRPAKFVVKYVVDSTTRLNAVRSGQATVSLLTPNQVPTAENTDLEIKVNPTSSRWNIYLNTSGTLKDRRVRQAIMHSIDRKSIAKALSFETGEPTVQLIPDGLPGHVDGALEKYPYDVEKAKKLLADAGHSKFTLDYVLFRSPEYSQLTDVLKEQLKAVGITLKVTEIDISQAGIFNSGETGDAMLARWGGRADQLETLNVVVSEDGTYSPDGAATPAIQEYLDKAAENASGTDDRDKWIMKANQEVIDQAATIPIMTRSNIYGYKESCVNGLNPYLAAGSNDWRDVTVSSDCSN